MLLDLESLNFAFRSNRALSLEKMRSKLSYHQALASYNDFPPKITIISINSDRQADGKLLIYVYAKKSLMLLFKPATTNRYNFNSGTKN